MSEFGAEKDEIIGTVEISLHSKFFFGDYVPYVSNLAVNPAHRRQGIGRKLLLKCEQIALDWGFQEISLHVLENNYQAKRLYFSSGYRLCRIEYSVISWLFKRPRRLLLNKRILLPRQQSNFSGHGGKSG
jgi:ribosomal protein S18 acetylase RimI-like enzyme